MVTKKEKSEKEKEKIKILSWDVGIINLAYCVIEKEDNDFNIKKWGTINLVEDRQKCEFLLRTGSQCSQTAKFCVYHTDKIKLFKDKNIMHSCSKHKEKIVPEVKIISEKKKMKCQNCDLNGCNVLGESEYCWCDSHYEKKGKSFVSKIKTKKVTVVSCNKQPMQELSEKLFSKLDEEHKDFMDVDRVIIENQPSLRNPTMKTISALLYSYFVMRGISDSTKTNSNIKEVRFVSPSNKLKVNTSATAKVLDNDDKTKVYKLTKKLGVAYCKALVSESDNKLLNEVKKKDDMCDAFLQGFQHLFNPVPQIHFDKIKDIGFDDIKKKPKAKKI